MNAPLELLVAIAVLVIVVVGWSTTPFSVPLLILTILGFVPATYFTINFFRKNK